MAEITLKIKGDVRDAEASINRLQKSIDRLQGGGGIRSGVSAVSSTQVREFQRVSQQISQINTANERARSQVSSAAARERIAEANNIAKIRIASANNATRAEIAAARNSTRIQITEANNAAKAAENAKKREYQEFVRLERQKTAAAKAEANKRSALDRFGGGAQRVGGGLQSAGTGASATVTAPLIAIATLGVKASLELDKIRQQFTGIEGSADAANKKIKELQQFANQTKNVTFDLASTTYGQLKPLKVNENIIRKQTQALGNLGQDADFSRNLLQIFQQGFERGDIKEAIGRVPLFEQILGEVSKQFNVKDSAGLKKLKESGKLTLDQFLEGFSDAVNNNPNFANTGELLSIKLQKGMDRLNQSLAPLGDVILQTIIPAFEQLVPYVQKASEFFASLDPAVQTAAVAFGAFVAALGPAAIAIGSVVEAVGTISTAIAGIGGLAVAGEIIGGIVLALGALAAAAAALYLAWTTNFGKIQDYTAEAAKVIEEYWSAGMNAVNELTAEVTAEVLKYWEENGEDIKAALSKVSAFVQRGLQAIADFWRDNGATIKEIAAGVWENVRVIVVGGIKIVGQAIRLIAAVINGDWRKAWDSAQKIQAQAWEIIKTVVRNGVANTINLLKLLVKEIIAMAQFSAKELVSVGENIINGLIEGMKAKAPTATSVATSIIKAAINPFSLVPKVQSPSRVTTEIGQFIVEGLVVGMENRAQKAAAAAKKIIQDTLKEYNDAVKDFSKLAGASPESVLVMQATNRIKDAVSSQGEIVSLRRELGVNQDMPLPVDVAGTEAELRYLKQKKQMTEDYWKILEDVEESQKEILQEAAEFDEKLRSIEQNGASQLLDLQEQIDLTGVVNEHERQRIQDAYDLQRLRQEMAADGYGENQIEEAAQILEIEQNRLIELREILRVQKEVADATEFGESLVGRLEDLQNGNREVTEYEKTLRRIADDYRDISPEQKEYLLGLARQIDAQKLYNEKYEETYDLIRDSLDLLTESGRSFGDKMKDIFGGIANRFRQMLLDMAAQWLTSKLFKTAGGGFSLGNLLNVFTGGGSGAGGFGGIGGTPSFNPNAFAGGGDPFGSINLSNPGQIAGALSSGGRITPGINGGIANAGGSGGFGLSGGLAIGGMAASFLGSAIGGRAGGFLSNIGSGVAIGAQIGSIIPGLGTAVGAIVGGGIGFLKSLFGGDPKRKADKKENLPKLQQGFVDAFKEFNDLIGDVRALRADPDSALGKGRELRAAIASGFGIQFQSKKYKKQSQELIKQQLAAIDREPDGLMAQLVKAVEVAKAAGERERRIIPEFADGGAISKFFSNHFSGLVPGVYDRRDDKLIAVSGNEVVLTPRHWQPIAPYLKSAGVPGFADGGLVAAAPSGGTINFNGNIVLEGVIALPNARAYLETEDGQRQVIGIVNNANKNFEIDPIKKK